MKPQAKSHEKPHSKSRSKKIVFAQFVYLTGALYAQNNLYTSAAACTFGLLFSFIPIVITVLAILVRVIHASPQLIASLLKIAEHFKFMFDAQSFVASLAGDTSVGWFDFLLALFILWMARKSSATVMQGMQRIFHSKTKSRPLFNQAVIFLCEIAFIVIAVLLIIIIFAIRQIFTLSIFSRLPVPDLLGFFPNVIMTLAEFALIFVLVMLAYRYMSGTKPKPRICLACSALCTCAFFVVAKLTNEFLNVSNYNIIYGVLSSLMILLFQMYMFFTLFFIGAQAMYVVQFFDSLLLAELYLLPKHNDTAPLSIVKRALFITPPLLMGNGYVAAYKKGEVIYQKGERPICAYYVVDGTVLLNINNNYSYRDKGAFFGEESCILEEPRRGDATAESDCSIMKIPSVTFKALLTSNRRASEKALAHVTNFIEKVYARE